MTNSGNIGNRSQGSPDSIPAEPMIFIQPPKDTDAHKTKGAQPNDYYADTQASDGMLSEKVSGKHLNNIPPPNAQISGNTQTTGVVGNAGNGNPFLAPNPLVAFFITFTELSNILRELTMAQEQINLIEMSIINDLASGEAAQILTAAEAEKNMYYASAASSFAEAGVSMGQALATTRAEKSAENQLNKQKTDLKTEVETSKTNLNTAEGELNTAKTTVKTSKQNLEKAEKNLEAAEKLDNTKLENREKVKAARAEVQEAENNLKVADDDKREKSWKVNKAENRLETAKRDLENHDIHYIENRQRLVQSSTFKMQMWSQACSKLTDAFANVAKASLAMQKAQAEAIQKMMSSYQQTAFKVIEAITRKESSQMIADLFQQLRKFSDDAKKLGGSIGSMA